MFIQTLNSSYFKFGDVKSENRLSGKAILEFFKTFSLNAHHYLAYHIGANGCDRTVPTL